jgi:hypothetical protein
MFNVNFCLISINVIHFLNMQNYKFNVVQRSRDKNECRIAQNIERKIADTNKRRPFL